MQVSYWMSLVLLLSVGQGLFLAVSLLLGSDKALRLPNRLLAALLLVLVAIIGHAWLGVNALFGDYPHLASAIATLPLLVGPLLWLYLRSLLQGAVVSWRSAAAHALPFLLALLVWAPYYLQPPEWKLGLLAARSHLPWYLAAFGAIKALHLAAYLLACYRLIQRGKQAAPTQALVRSLHHLTLWLGAGLAIDAALFAAEVLEWPTPVSSDLWGAAVLIGFVYGLAFYAMRLPLSYQPPLPLNLTNAPSESLLLPAERTQFLQKLTYSMETTQLYRDGTLTLEQLAQHLALTPHELSQLINQSFQMNLQEFLNGYRVAALQQAICDGTNADSTILDLAFSAGFNSKSSLNRVFKNHTGMTPTQFRDATQTSNSP